MSKYFIHRIYSNVTLSDNKTIVTIHVYSREGLKSPDSWYYEFNGRLISPYEQKIRNWPRPSLNWLFKRVYGHLVENLIVSRDSFLKKIPKDEIWISSKVIPIPFSAYINPKDISGYEDD